METDEKKESSRFQDIPEHLKDYVKTKIALLKLEVAEKASSIASGAVLGLLLLIFGWLFILFASIAAAVAISDSLEKPYLGFLIIAGFYLLLAIIVFIFRDTILTKPITNSIIQKIEGNEKDTSEDTQSGNAEN